MSKILFWSPLHGQGQTSNIHAIACIMSLFHKRKVLLMQTQYSKNNLEAPLVGKNVGTNRGNEWELFQDIGLDAAITFSNMGSLNRSLLESCCFSIPDTKLLLLPGSETKNRETFERDVGRSVSRMIKDAELCVDVVLIDSNSGDNELSFKLMQLADLVVINLTQRKYVLDKFFSEYGEKFIENERVFYLFGDYDDNSCYNINNCRKKYKRYINSRNSGVVPYSTKYMDAQNECSLVPFMREGLRIRNHSISAKVNYVIRVLLRPGKYTPDETSYFFHRTKMSVEKMFEMLGISVKVLRKEGSGG